MSTHAVVDTLEEQRLLEDILEEAKPATADDGLHYLLQTPFRYPPLPHGSRFGRTTDRGIWYGSADIETALAEVTYYLYQFSADTDHQLVRFTVRRTLVAADVFTAAGLDLCGADWLPLRDDLLNPGDYSVCQQIGDAMRAHRVEAFMAPSARRPGGRNLNLLDAAAFAGTEPAEQQLWVGSPMLDCMVWTYEGGGPRHQVVVSREQLLVRGWFPGHPAS